jgi:hypothetical protein
VEQLNVAAVVRRHDRDAEHDAVAAVDREGRGRCLCR